MFLVEDTTKKNLDKIEAKKSGQYYHIIMDILPIKNKDQLANPLPNTLRNASFPQDLVGPEGKTESLLKDSGIKAFFLKDKKKFSTLFGFEEGRFSNDRKIIFTSSGLNFLVLS